VLGGRVDGLFLADPRTICLEVYAGQRWFIVISANPSDPRVYVTRDRPSRGTDAVTPFLLLLRKYVRGGRITDVRQPRLERILSIAFSTRVDEGPSRSVELIAELMGRRSNVILLNDEQTILDALIRLPPSVNAARPLLPHLHYRVPTPENKADPSDPFLAGILRSHSQGANGEGWRVVMTTVAGFSPLAAQEVVARATGSPSTASAEILSWKDLAESVQELVVPIETHAWQPSVAWADGGVADFAPYLLCQFPHADIRRYESMSQAIVQTGGARQAARAVPFDALRRPLLDAIASRSDSVCRKRGSLERSLAMADRADSLREAGEAILANAAQIEAGATSLTWEGRRIDLYPTLTPVENAQAYFRQYTAARDAKRVVPPLLKQVASEIEYLEDMALAVEGSESERELSAIRRELEDAEVISQARPQKKIKKLGQDKSQAKSGVVRRMSIEGAELLVGGSAEGNESVTFRLSRPDDLWFHVRGRPGSHVILRGNGSEATEKAISLAAEVAAAHSGARNEARVEVDYTARKYVRKIAGALPGRVTYRNETTITARPRSEPELRPERKTG